MNNLKFLRKNLGLTQREVSQKLGIPQANYGYYELGKVNPPIEVLFNLADFFNCSLDYLLGHRVRDITKTQEATPLQRSLCTDILAFGEEDCMRVEAFVEGLKSARKEQKKSKNANFVGKTEK